MRAREFDPRRFDVAAFAKAGATLRGEWPLASFERLRPALAAHDAAVAVSWQADGDSVAERGGALQVWLRLRAEARLPLQCQRCLEPVMQPVEVDRRYRFVRDEDEAARLDAEIEDEVLVLTRELDLHELLEDELLLDLPLVPRHDACPVPLPSASAAQASTEPESPFASLAVLRQPGR